MLRVHRDTSPMNAYATSTLHVGWLFASTEQFGKSLALSTMVLRQDKHLGADIS